ncbi:MAG: ADP-glyceromanno-heptose 6-epimerase [Ignavibacteriae bacterium]|nr:ADP-glyceromanno-heptose 6-epimerase [Ignavibacteriota bacterium]
MVVITGGAGFIGSGFVRKCNDEGMTDILIVDHLRDGNKWKNLIGKQYRDIVHQDVFREKFLSGEYDGSIEAIVHLGACSATTERNADYLLDNNYRYSVGLASAAHEKGIRFIYASSAATYGLGEQGYSDSLCKSLRPLNMYGYSKLLFDTWVLRNNLQNEFIGIRYFNVFGPNEYHKNNMASMILKAFRQVEEKGKISLFKSNSPEYADGNQMRDFVYIKDVCDIMWQMLQNKNISGIYNLGTGKARTWNDLAAAVFTAMNRDEIIEYIEMPDSISSQYQNFTEADLAHLQNSGLEIKFRTLEESIEDYVANYLMQGESYW